MKAAAKNAGGLTKNSAPQENEKQRDVVVLRVIEPTSAEGSDDIFKSLRRGRRRLRSTLPQGTGCLLLPGRRQANKMLAGQSGLRSCRDQI
jgi:hypothetical protein